jgi:hypothetical protein
MAWLKNSPWRTFTLASSNVIGCADVRKISVFPFSHVFDGATSVLCLECICVLLGVSQCSLQFQNDDVCGAVAVC